MVKRAAARRRPRKAKPGTKGLTPAEWLLAILPIDAVEPTPFQRDLSDTHHKRLADVINKTGRFLDPIIAVIAPKGGFWTPNGRHRLEAMRRLGLRRSAR